MYLKRSWLISGTAVAGLVLAFNNCDGFSALKLNPETGASQSLTDVQVDSQTSAEFWDQARDRGVRTMSSGIALEPGADTCEIVGDFPIRTHFRNGVGPSPGGVDVPELFNKNIEQEVARGQALVRVYSNGYTPRHANYLEDNYDSQVYSDDTIKSALRHLCAAGAMRVRFRQTNAPITSTADIQNLIVPGERSFQVLHGLIFRRNLFTVIVPPMWNSSVSLSTLIHNGYSLNHQVATATGMYTALRQAYAADSRGAIGVLWNGGGATASYTVSNDAYRDFNDFARLLTAGVGVDANKVVAFGGSRGGHGTQYCFASGRERSAGGIRFCNGASFGLGTADQLKLDNTSCDVAGGGGYYRVRWWLALVFSVTGARCRNARHLFTFADRNKQSHADCGESQPACPDSDHQVTQQLDVDSSWDHQS